jgi:hypothetical protein
MELDRRRAVPRQLVLAASVCALAGSLFALFSNIGVGEPARTCGTVFDTLVDRSGWEDWWALDLDDPDETVRSKLVRTEHCPGSINQRLAVAVGLGGLGLILGGLMRNRPAPRIAGGPQSIGHQLYRVGRATSIAGAALGIAGLVGIIVLTADADSTLFLYTDRIVVAVIGLVVLVPTLALFAIGRALMVLGPHLPDHKRDPEEDGEADDRG